MHEEFEDSYEDLPPTWFWDNLSIYGQCVTWESCICGYSTLVTWVKGKSAGVVVPCTECGEQNYTMGVVATIN